MRNGILISEIIRFRTGTAERIQVRIRAQLVDFAMEFGGLKGECYVNPMPMLQIYADDKKPPGHDGVGHSTNLANLSAMRTPMAAGTKLL